jgi:hypothetical protein
MKSKSLLLAMLFGVTLSTVACKKCQTCTSAGGDEIEACREGVYNTPQLYTVYINSLENQGYDCK